MNRKLATGQAEGKLVKWNIRLFFQEAMMIQLAFTTLHAQNSKLTHALYTAAMAPHTNRLVKRRAQWVTRGQAVIAQAQFWYGEQVAQALWLQLRPRVVDSRLAADQARWVAQVVGMLDEFALSQPLADDQAITWPTASIALSAAEQAVALAHNWPKKVAAWVFHSEARPQMGLELLKARGHGQTLAALGEKLGLQAVDDATILRAVAILVPPFAPTPQPLMPPKITKATSAVAEPKPPAKEALSLPPQFEHEVWASLHHIAKHGGQKQLVLPLALNLASLVNRMRQFGQLKQVRLMAPTITSGGLHELAATLDQALILNHAAVTIVGPTAGLTAATQADLLELAQAGATLLTPKRRTLGAKMLQLQFERMHVVIMGSSDITASDYHTSLQLDSLWLSKTDPVADWWQSLSPHLVPLVPKVAPVAHRQALLSKHHDNLANFKAAIAQLKDRDTHARMTAWLAYEPQPPVAMTLDGQAYFALAFPQYHMIVVDTFVPNNALFYQASGMLSAITTASSKQALLALGAKRAYHTDVPIGVRVRRILQSGGK